MLKRFSLVCLAAAMFALTASAASAQRVDVRYYGHPRPWAHHHHRAHHHWRLRSRHRIVMRRHAPPSGGGYTPYTADRLVQFRPR